MCKFCRAPAAPSAAPEKGLGRAAEGLLWGRAWRRGGGHTFLRVVTAVSHWQPTRTPPWPPGPSQPAGSLDTVRPGGAPSLRSYGCRLCRVRKFGCGGQCCGNRRFLCCASGHGHRDDELVACREADWHHGLHELAGRCTHRDGLAGHPGGTVTSKFCCIARGCRASLLVGLWSQPADASHRPIIIAQKWCLPCSEMLPTRT